MLGSFLFLIPSFNLITKSGWFFVQNRVQKTFCKGPAGKYFQLCEPFGFCCNSQFYHWSKKVA